LQAAFEGAQQESDQDREGEDALPGECLWIGTMLGNEIGIVEGFGEVGEDGGMDTAKRPSYIYPLLSIN
jgi:hypothetical protein